MIDENRVKKLMQPARPSKATAELLGKVDALVQLPGGLRKVRLDGVVMQPVEPASTAAFIDPALLVPVKPLYGTEPADGAGLINNLPPHQAQTAAELCQELEQTAARASTGGQITDPPLPRSPAESDFYRAKVPEVSGAGYTQLGTVQVSSAQWSPDVFPEEPATPELRTPIAWKLSDREWCYGPTDPGELDWEPIYYIDQLPQTPAARFSGSVLVWIAFAGMFWGAVLSHWIWG